MTRFTKTETYLDVQPRVSTLDGSGSSKIGIEITYYGSLLNGNAFVREITVMKIYSLGKNPIQWFIKPLWRIGPAEQAVFLSDVITNLIQLTSLAHAILQTNITHAKGMVFEIRFPLFI